MLKANRPNEAVFRDDLPIYPYNGCSLFGLRQTPRIQGIDGEALEVINQFERAWSRADVELTRAAL